MQKTVLYLIPVNLVEDQFEVLPDYALKIVREMDEFVVENEKSARAFLKRIGSTIPQASYLLHLLNEHSTAADQSILSDVLKKRKNIGLMSEAGCPGIADPGSELVRMAHESGIEVIPLIGPSSIFLGLMGSGLNGQSFTFHGYLPRESNLRKNKLRDIERDALKKNQTQIFIETPYRNDQMLADMLEVLNPETRICIGVNLTSPQQFLKTNTVLQWKKKVPSLHKNPTVFLIGK